MRDRRKDITKQSASARPRSKKNINEAKPVRPTSKAAPPITARADSPSEASLQQIATKPSREVEMTADWWTALHSAFAGSDDSLYMVEVIEELEGIEVRRYLRIDGGTDLSRAEFEERETKAGLALNLPPGVEPLDHWRNKLKKDQEDNNPDPQCRGLEIVTAKTVGISEEEKKEYSADLVKWSEARREAEDVINEELLADLVKRRKARRDKDSSIDSPTVDLLQVHFDKTVGIALKRGVSPQLILIMRNAQQMVTRQSCIIPKVAEAGAAYCSRLAVKARKLERRKTKRGKKPTQQIIDRTRDIARLAFKQESMLVIAIYLDDCNYPTPHTWRTPGFAPKGEKFETGIQVPELRKSFRERISKAKRKYPVPTPVPN